MAFLSGKKEKKTSMAIGNQGERIFLFLKTSARGITTTC
jgi:hypothetical protein